VLEYLEKNVPLKGRLIMALGNMQKKVKEFIREGNQ